MSKQMTSFQCNELKHELDETINVKITLIRFDGDIIYIQNDFRPIFNVFVSDDVDHNVPVAKTFFNVRLYNQSVKENTKRANALISSICCKLNHFYLNSVHSNGFSSSDHFTFAIVEPSVPFGLNRNSTL